MPSVIPLRSDLPHFDLDAELEGTSYALEFYWNTRESCWYLHFFVGHNREHILSSVKAVVDQPLGFRYKLPKMPKGCLMLTDTTGEQRDPVWSNDTQRSDLGDRVQLLYFASTEMPVT